MLINELYDLTKETKFFGNDLRNFDLEKLILLVQIVEVEEKGCIVLSKNDGLDDKLKMLSQIGRKGKG